MVDHFETNKAGGLSKLHHFNFNYLKLLNNECLKTMKKKIVCMDALLLYRTTDTMKLFRLYKISTNNF